MNPLDDATLLDLLERRVGSGALRDDERDKILRAVAAGRASQSRANAWTLSRRWIGFAAAALSVVLVAAVVLKAPTELGPPSIAPPGRSTPSTSATDAAPTKEPIVPTRIFSPQELADMIGGDRVGDVVMAMVRIADIGIDPKRCPPPNPCDDAALADVSGHNAVAIGWRLAREGEGTRYGDEATGRWLTRVLPPADPGVFAFRILADAVEYLGPVVEAGAGAIVWRVGDVQAGEHANPSNDLYAVEGWLARTPFIRCAIPLPNTNPDYWCGGSFVTAEPVDPVVDGGVLADLGGLRVQGDAYHTFARNPSPPDAASPQPRVGTYLVRSAGCPVGVNGDCPVWSMVGRLGETSPEQRPTTTPSRPPVDDFPLEIDGEQVLTTDEARSHVLNSHSAEPFLVGGWVTVHVIDCVTDPNLPVTPLLEPCEGGHRIGRAASDPFGQYSLVVDSVWIPLREWIVLRVHSNDARAADCPEPYVRRCETAIVVDELVWRASQDSLPARSDAILTADQLAELALDPVPVGRVLLARASIDLSTQQPADVRCVEPHCSIGILDASGPGVPVFVNSGMPTPNASDIQAFRLVGDALEFVGPVQIPTGTTTVAWTVDEIRSFPPIASEFLYPVDGWLVEPVNDHECPEPPDAGPNAEYHYWCASSWLSDHRVYLDPLTTGPQDLVPGALHLQNRAYSTFAVNPDTEGVRGAEPRHDIYLVRSVSCPEVRVGDCPVWELAATLDAGAAPNGEARAECFSIITTTDSVPSSAQQRAHISDAIVVGTLTSLGPVFWDSPDGRRPTSHRSMIDSRLVTSLDIAVDRTLKGAMTDYTVKLGGTYGCVTSTYDPAWSSPKAAATCSSFWT